MPARFSVYQHYGQVIVLLHNFKDLGWCYFVGGSESIIDLICQAAFLAAVSASVFPATTPRLEDRDLQEYAVERKAKSNIEISIGFFLQKRRDQRQGRIHSADLRST